MDLEGIVAKHSLAPYTTDTTWFKIKNRGYSQLQCREELFERERHIQKHYVLLLPSLDLVGTKQRVRGHGLKIVLPTRLRTQRWSHQFP